MTRRDADGNVIDEEAHLFRVEPDADVPLVSLLAALARPPAEPCPDGLPFVTPTTWPRVGGYDDGRHRCGCGKCGPCRYYARIEREAFARPWQEAVPPPKPQGRPRWPSVEAALSWYAEVAYGAPSTSDFERLASYGTHVQWSAVPSAPRATRDAEDVADIERCLAVAYGPDNDRGLGAAVCLDVLFARRVGTVRIVKMRKGGSVRMTETAEAADLAAKHGVSPATIGAIVRSGMGRLRAEFSARGLTGPLSRSSPSYVEAERRREELWRRR